MERFYTSLKVRGTWVFLLAVLTPLALITNTALAITASIGRPYQGKLKNGIPFPREFSGYQLRAENHTYTTPEVVGALLDAFEGVHQQYPDTCDLYIGDFSLKDGGWINHHRSHQNGRDVDLGMYAKGNTYLDRFILMNRTNLDVPKTWRLVENILRSQKVQYIFLDRNIQRLLYDYALSRGQSQAFLDRLFGNTKGAVIQHLRGHRDHMHVRFFTPWSSLAGQLQDMDSKKQQVIEMAQQSFLPKKVHYYVKGNEPNLNVLANSFGVSSKDLCRWNRLRGNNVLTPGSCLVFYKRGFELEPVHLAQTLQADLALDSVPVQLASLSPKVLRDLPASNVSEKSQRRQKTTKKITYKVQKGDTLRKIAQRCSLRVDDLCRLNDIKRSSIIRPGQVLEVASIDLGDSDSGRAAPRNSQQGKKAAESRIYTVRSGDTIWEIAKSNGLDVATLCKLNGFGKGAVIRPGQKLKIVSSNHHSISGKRKQSASTYTIKSGENLWLIAKKYKTTTQVICQLNGLSANTVLHPGLKIKLP